MASLQSMRVFVEIADAGSLAAAADRVGISSAMVGKHLRGLEVQLGSQLLQRTTRRQSLTDAGALFLDRCRLILREVADAEESVARIRGVVAGNLRIHAPVSFGVQLLSPAIQGFLGRYPRVAVDLSLDDVPPQASDAFDFSFQVGPLPESSLIARPLTHYRMVVCAAPAYLKARGVPNRPPDLAQHDCLGLTHWGSDHAWRFRSTDGEVSVPVRYRMRVNNGPALRTAALAGGGIIQQPTILVGQDIADGRLIALLRQNELPTRRLYLLYPRNRGQSAKAAAFVKFAVGLAR